MSIEQVGSSETVDPAVLESFKANPDAPFDVVAKNEEPPEYSFSFLGKLKGNWEKACQVMDWEKEGQALDWNFFKVSSNPEQVVILIQEKLLEEGGELPVHGVDGKFGPETEAALNYVAAKEVAAAVTSSQVKALASVVASVSGEQEGGQDNEQENVSAAFNENMDQIMRQKMPEMIDAMPGIEARLGKAGLNLDDWRKVKDFSSYEVAEFQTNASVLRDDLISEEPRLEPLSEVVEGVISIIYAEIQKIDLDSIYSMQDLAQVLKGFEGVLESHEDEFSEIISDDDAMALIRDLDIEILMTFFMSVVAELVVLLLEFFKDNEENLERIMQVLQDEFLLKIKPMQSNSHAVFEDNANWSDLVSKGLVSTGELEFVNAGRSVVLNVEASTISVGEKNAKLILPVGAQLKSVQALADGSFALNVSVMGLTTRKVLSLSDLTTNIDGILAKNTGERIDLGQGAYLQV